MYAFSLKKEQVSKKYVLKNMKHQETEKKVNSEELNILHSSSNPRTGDSVVSVDNSVMVIEIWLSQSLLCSGCFIHTLPIWNRKEHLGSLHTLSGLQVVHYATSIVRQAFRTGVFQGVEPTITEHHIMCAL